ncbi:FAD-dependent oxidoreductase [Sellimonas catena]|uniref:2-enoate reductase n=1 Tax=Sellimonas catena TaxID=2994035 RepID=A0A9W6CGB0_9FIRM|nr:FAD-dependent oxidoreductase [Sellimonas catena]GLG91815.1 2-enoate reductase [Sellimonas catena]
MGYEKLFTPFKVGNMEVKNRIGMSPMGTNSSFTNGRKDAQEIDYFIERAKGGAGIIFMGCQMLNEKIAQGSMEGYLDTYTVLPSLTSVCDGVHRYGAKIVCQISPGTGRNAFPDTFGNPPISSSETPSVFNPEIKCHAMTKEEIAQMMEGFKFAAGLAQDAGYDAIEIHAHAGYLIDQFMSPVWNLRTDEYGGSPENCARFPKEIIQAIKSVVGDTMPVIFRISLDHRFPGGRTMDDSLKLLKILEEAGVDAFDIDAGCYETLDYIFPPSYLGESCMSYVCEEARKTVQVPLFTAGTLAPDSALALIESGVVDFTNMGRALIADPELPNKLMEGRPEDIRPCLRCNEYCIGRIWNKHTKLGCAVNPQAMEEVRFAVQKTDQPKNVVVIGGGPAGMEAARVAAIEGHHVTLFEKSDHLGGVMGDICTASFKQNIKKLTTWYKVQLKKLNVDVHLNTEITGEEEILASCDKIIAGCGAKPVIPPIPGIDGENVISILDVHRNPSLLKGEQIVVCGGGASGLDGALEMASEMGKKVTVVEMLPQCGKDVFFINQITLFRKLAESNVTLMTSTKVIAMDDKGLTVECEDGAQKRLEADTIVSAFGMRPDLTVVDKIKEKYHIKTRVIGDSSRLGKIGEAVRDGFYAATSL